MIITMFFGGMILLLIIFIIVVKSIFLDKNDSYLPPMHDDIVINEDTKKAESDSKIILPF